MTFCILKKISANKKIEFLFSERYIKSLYLGGELGIRTPKSLRTPVFKTGAIAVLPALQISKIEYRTSKITVLNILKTEAESKHLSSSLRYYHPCQSYNTTDDESGSYRLAQQHYGKQCCKYRL